MYKFCSFIFEATFIIPFMKFFYPLFLLFSLLSLGLQAATCTALASTNWTLASTWSCGSAPGCNDVIVIPAGFTVTINSAVDLTGAGCNNTKIDIYGVLFFSGNASRLSLVSTATINIHTGGKITTDQANNSQKITIGTGPAEWDSNTGNLSGPWTITNGNSGPNSVLPIELIYFKGSCHSNEMELSWATATEKDNAYFLLEKSSNALDWLLVATINGSGTSNTIKTYEYHDPINTSGLVYYRLSQIDKLGTGEVFKAIDVNCENNSQDQFLLYPNPSSYELNVLLNTGVDSKNGHLKIMNFTGKVILDTNIQITKGENSFHIPLDLAAGTYFVAFDSEELALPAQKITVIK